MSKVELQYLKELDLHGLAEIDGGRIGAAITQALARVAGDLDDRPADDRPRKVALEIVAVPELDEHGHCDNIKLQMQVKETYPSRKSKVYDLGLRRSASGKRLVYSPASPDDHRQPGLMPEMNEVDDYSDVD